jgi:SAM-dependent methyltransferase
VLLSQQGYQVTGVDRSSFLMDKARQRAAEFKVQAEFVLQDMREFVRPQAYDLALSLFTSFGYFQEKQEDMQVLRNIHTSLKRGGALVMDLMSKEIIAAVFQPTRSEVHADGVLFVQRCEIVDDWRRVRNEWLLIRENQASRFQFEHTIYSGRELKDRLVQVGFEPVELYGDLCGLKYGPEAKRLVVVAYKP